MSRHSTDSTRAMPAAPTFSRGVPSRREITETYQIRDTDHRDSCDDSVKIARGMRLRVAAVPGPGVSPQRVGEVQTKRQKKRKAAKNRQQKARVQQQPNVGNVGVRTSPPRRRYSTR
jgi:hypothetical protein